ncbi:MAG: acetyl-CoA carboxylase carboxyltransferase subunit alpha [Deltaproteobacteria bacterium]|nr:acetyl-CoA carboxylase carboxyltransferase subunit alpha [Deltaproteobacteria bacterium]
MEPILEFEKPIVELERKLHDLSELSKQEKVSFSSEIKVLEKKLSQLIETTFTNLTPWQRVQLSRHPNRPYTYDYINAIFPDFLELHGDRYFADDPAIIAGTATWPPRIKNSKITQLIPICILGHQKGRTTKQKMERNFGMAKPEGYRKAIRLMELANRTKMPIITFIDTPGAYPGMDAEERGQAQAIAECLHMMFSLKVPVLSVVIAEGGSGGALAIGIADKILMLEYSTYSVISPESCASILWSDASFAEKASACLKMSPQDLLKLEIIDGIISEPKGGAHRNWEEASELLGTAIIKHFQPLLFPKNKKALNNISDLRALKFRKIGLKAIAHA